MSGAVQPASSMRCLISGTAAAASGVLTVTRTISDPASASSTHCRAVARRVGRVGHRHALDDDGRAAADLDGADVDGNGAVEADRRGGIVPMMPRPGRRGVRRRSQKRQSRPLAGGQSYNE